MPLYNFPIIGDNTAYFSPILTSALTEIFVCVSVPEKDISNLVFLNGPSTVSYTHLTLPTNREV